ncbi:hypothetical protein KR505_09335 [Eubacterium callanderi]|uniref:hypothetical protein n=1 Tax=Eubacterium callanderi TaxID=53442 RepID=UPI001C2D9175|nr:hypothetical protein [Eubacterium callanderi]MBV1683602.1 hypothetical protein [Eubacterium callanderi]
METAQRGAGEAAERQKKMKMNPEKKKILTEIFDIVTEINGEERKRGGHLCVFLSVSPHISEIEIRVFEHGWIESYSGETYRAAINVDVNKQGFGDLSLAEMLQYLRALKGDAK